MEKKEYQTGRDAVLDTTLDFLVEYARCLLASGVHTSRVIRNAVRIAESQGMDLNVLVTLKCLILTLRNEGERCVLTRVVAIPPRPISFALNTSLSALSWEAYDNQLSLDEIKSRYQYIVSCPRLPYTLVLVLLSLANGAFCYLFGGDVIAIAAVVLATAVGYMVKEGMIRLKANPYFVFMVSAFAASMCASAARYADCTWQIALAASPLFLVPGVPLINSVIDAVEGHVLTAVSRLVNAVLLVISIAVGLACTLLLVTHELPVAPL